MDTIKMYTGNTQMVAHAGLMGMESANTNAGFIAAGNRSYWGIECDVRVAKDGFVIIHNNTTAGVSPIEMTVEDRTVAELQSIPLYDRPFFYGMEEYGLTPGSTEVRADLRIPTLEEYVRICKRYGKVCVLELKHPMTPETIAAVAEQYRSLDYVEGVVFISFHWENLVEMRKCLPSCTVQYLTDDKHVFTEEFLDKAAENRFDLDIHIFTTTKELVERIHARGLKVNVWTCDWLDRFEQLVEWGVDYITSNIIESAPVVTA